MKQKIIVGIFVLLLTLQLVDAVGIRPAKTNLIFEEGKDYSKTIWVVNNEQRDLTVSIYVEGEMKEYVSVSQKTVTLRSDDDSKEIGVEVHLPENVPAGTSTANIVFEETLDEAGSENVVSSKVVLKHKVLIEGPYPDKYVKAKLNFQEQGNLISFVSEVENLGKEEVESVKTTFYVNDKKQELQTLETEETSLGKKENKLLSTKIAKDVFEQGEFEVSAVTTYDDQKVEVVKKLLVGKPRVEMTYFDKYFIANKINQYSMDLLNKWNQQIKNVYVDVEVSKDNQKIDQFRTKSVDLDAETMKRISDYFDARDKDEGKYVFKMIVNFWNNIQMDQEEFQVELLTEDQFEEVSKGNINAAVVGKASSEGSSFSGGLIAIIIVGLLALISMIFVGYRYFTREEI
ncbi:MAG: hypothetical protein KKA62_05240 [Nanoarchaeota archaeon]|nr:hypothetical protein [Nanoarchaeota archaeon]MBU1643692.1 hypothetical protein [Nanoarchaeota archaeon]MBU1977326.1 hypothetical protein [Nanoarchaeota archaeon]